MAEKRSNLWRDLAERLRGDFQSASHGLLPPIRILCLNYGVSHPTLRKAIRHLQSQGFVAAHRGRRIRLSGESIPEKPEMAPGLSSRERVTEALERKIREGLLKANRPLPKIAMLAAESGVSTNTVIIALKSLLRKQLISKRGRQWVVGKPIKASLENPDEPPPLTILLIQTQLNSWTALRESRTVRFFQAFTDEAQSHGVRLLPCLTHSSDGRFTLFPVGAEAILHCIRKLESHYLGSIIVGQSTDFPEFPELVKALTNLRRPVAWFDLKETTSNPVFKKRSFRHCRFSESIFAATALEHLVALGHVRIAYVGGFNASSWQQARLQWLRQAANRLGGNIEVESYHEARARMLAGGPASLAIRLSRLHREGRPHAQKTVAYAMDSLRQNGCFGPSGREDPRRPSNGDYGILARELCSSSLGQAAHALGAAWRFIPYLLNDEVTVLLATRDYLARGAFAVLSEIGIRFPGDLSFLSFDNYLDATVLPVTTLDNGAGDLGYRTFHAILRDVPVAGGKTGELVARPSVVNRGTLGYPGRRGDSPGL